MNQVGRLRATFALALLLLAAIGTQAAAQHTILLKNGNSRKGWIVSDDGSKVVVRIAAGGGHAETTLKYDQLDPRTIYRLRLGKVKDDDAKGQMDLAAFALDNGLFSRARLHYRRALKADEALGGELDSRLKALRARAAGVINGWCRKWIDEGKILDARKWLGEVAENFPDTAEADEARQMLEQIHDRSMAARRKKTESRHRGPSERAKAELKTAKKAYDKAHDYIKQGLLNTKYQGRAVRYFQQAIAEFNKAGKLLKKKIESAGREGDDAYLSHLQSLEQTLTEETWEAQLNLASVYFTRGSLKNALEIVNDILAQNPNHSEARAMRARLEIAINDDGWGRRGRR